MLKIESAHNATFKKLLSLTTAKGLRHEKLFLLSGEKLVREFLEKPTLEIAFEITTRALKPLSSSRHAQLPAELFAKIDALGTGFNVLALAQPEIGTLKAADLPSYKPQGIEVVLPAGDPGNLGALLRSCEAFGIPRVILTKEAAHPFLPRAVKASAGSVLRLPIARGPALAEFPADSIALDMDGAALKDFIWPQNGLLVVGEEGRGIGRKNKFTRRIRIPTQGVESLNVVAAASIALAHKAGCV